MRKVKGIHIMKICGKDTYSPWEGVKLYPVVSNGLMEGTVVRTQ